MRGAGEGTGVRRCASRTSVLAFHNKIQTRGNASNSVTGVFADSTCLYLSRRYSTNYVCLLSNVQFVCAPAMPGRVTLTALLAHFERFSHAERRRSDGYFGNRVCAERKRGEEISPILVSIS